VTEQLLLSEFAKSIKGRQLVSSVAASGILSVSGRALA